MSDYTAPVQSANYQKLLNVLKKQGGDCDQLRQVLWGLNTPGHLKHFGWVTQKIKGLLYHRNALLGGFREFPRQKAIPDDQFLTQLQHWCDFYSANQTVVDWELGQEFELGPPSKKHPLQNRGMSRHGLYAALLCTTEEKQAQDHWELLALRFLMTHRQRMQAWTLEGYETYDGKEESPDLPKKLYIPSKHLRYLTKSQYTPLLSGLVLEQIVGAGSLPQALEGEDGSTELKSLLRYMASTEKGERARSAPGPYRRRKTLLGRDMSRGQGFVDIDERVGLHQVDVDIDDPWGEDQPLSIVEMLQPDPSEKPEDLAGMDLVPGELADGDALSLVDQGCDDSPHKTMTNALAVRARHKHLAIQAQQFPWSYNQLTEFQLSFIHDQLEIEIRRLELLSCRSERDELLYQTNLLLLVMLWTGSSLERAVDLSIHHKKAASSDAQLGFYDHGAGYDGVQYEWRFKALTPEYLSRPQFDAELLRSRKQSFWLPDLIGVVGYLVRFREGKQSKRNAQLFTRGIKTYRQCAKTILKQVNTTLPGEGITVHKIERFLFRHIIAETADITAAAYITGQGHYLANTTIFYTTPSLDYLRSVYQKAIEPVLYALKKKGEGQLVSAKGHVGARHCVTLNACQGAIQRLQDELLSLAEYHDWESFVMYHNHLTFYMVLLFGFSAAPRAIRSPLVLSTDIDVNGLVHFADKDTEPPYHARLIWMPRWVVKQIQQYHIHLQLTAHRLRAASPNKAYPELAEPCYFIGGQSFNDAQVVKPSTLRPYYVRYLDVPANAHRRFLRTELVERGMPLESINAFMGHWSNGEEPWGPYSSFNVPAHIETLRRFVEPLLKELGFKSSVTFIEKEG